MPDLKEKVYEETKKAQRRIYELYAPTPLEPLDLGLSCTVWLKREDLSPIHSYKWRGAYHRMAGLSAQERAPGVIAASAGNHAQGVAVTAKKLGIHATIFMPERVAKTKLQAVRALGGGNVKIILTGHCYDEAFQSARDFAQKKGSVFIHPYDDLAVMGGQGTLAAEAVKVRGAHGFDLAYVQIGGGGMAAAVAAYLKTVNPKIRLVGVEAQGQACMQAAFQAERPVRLETLDFFCDGTSVKEAGAQCFALCRTLLDELVVVNNREVCQAMKQVWEAKRVLPEPSGALGIAGLLKNFQPHHGENALVILSGANMDFAEFAQIGRMSESALIPA